MQWLQLLYESKVAEIVIFPAKKSKEKSQNKGDLLFLGCNCCHCQMWQLQLLSSSNVAAVVFVIVDQ